MTNSPRLFKECIAGYQIRFAVKIPNEDLKSWYDLKEDGRLFSQFSLVEILNAVENGVTIRKDYTRIYGLIRRSCGEVKKQMSPAQFLAAMLVSLLL